MTITKEQKAWMAGVIETRGKIRFTNDPGRKTNQLVLQVRTANTAIAARMCELTGTAIDENDAKRIEYTDRRACTLHCPEPHVHVLYADIPENAVWAISGCGAAVILANLVKHFEATDKDEVRSIASNIFAGLPRDGRGRRAVDGTIIRLRRLGWWIPPAALEHFVGIPTPRSDKGRFVKQELTPA